MVSQTCNEITLKLNEINKHVFLMLQIKILRFRQAECQMIDLWDLVDNGTAKAAGKQPLCPILYRGNAYPFKRAFVNNRYVVLQLDYSYYVELKPKTSLNYKS